MPSIKVLEIIELAIETGLDAAYCESCTAILQMKITEMDLNLL